MAPDCRVVAAAGSQLGGGAAKPGGEGGRFRMFQYSEADIRKVKRVQFGILGPDEIKAMSVCHIESDRTFEGNKPVANGLMDPRLGSIDRQMNCTTCGMDHHECPGHFGHIELAKPMYHVCFITNIMKARARS